MAPFRFSLRAFILLSLEVAQRGHILLFSPKGHQELAGKGTEHDWGLSKRHCRKHNTCHTKTQMRRVLSSFETVTLAHCEKFAKRTRRHRATCLEIDAQQRAANLADPDAPSLSTHQAIERIYAEKKAAHLIPRDKLKSMMQTHATHRNVFDQEKALLREDLESTALTNLHGVAVVRKDVESGAKQRCRSIQAAVDALCKEDPHLPQRQTWFNVKRAVQDGVPVHGSEWLEGVGRRARHAGKPKPEPVSDAVLGAAEAEASDGQAV